MKRKKGIRLSPSERKRMLLVGASLLPVLAFGLWIRLSHHSIARVAERVVQMNGDLYMPIGDVGAEGALIFRLERSTGEPALRVFVGAQQSEPPVVTLAACRRCNQAQRPSYVLNNRLICGHCGEAMPILAKGAPLPKERDCTPLPLRFERHDGSVIVRAAEIEAVRLLLAAN